MYTCHSLICVLSRRSTKDVDSINQVVLENLVILREQPVSGFGCLCIIFSFTLTPLIV